MVKFIRRLKGYWDRSLTCVKDIHKTTVREVWDKASEINLYGYLGYSKGLNEPELRILAKQILSKMRIKKCKRL